MKTVHKYPLELTDVQTRRIPHHARLLTIQLQRGEICLWALVCPDNATVERRFHIVGTGNITPDGIDKMDFIGTVQQGAFVWHVFAEPENL